MAGNTFPTKNTTKHAASSIACKHKINIPQNQRTGKINPGNAASILHKKTCNTVKPTATNSKNNQNNHITMVPAIAITVPPFLFDMP